MCEQRMNALRKRVTNRQFQLIFFFSFGFDRHFSMFFFGEFHVWPDKTKVNFQIEEAKKRIKMRYKNTINTQFNPELIRRMFDRNHCRQITKNRTQWFAVFFVFAFCASLWSFSTQKFARRALPDFSP